VDDCELAEALSAVRGCGERRAMQAPHHRRATPMASATKADTD
jgi:hypothetical protein